MSRLPVPGSDNNAWGVILNDFLSQSLNSDGTLKQIDGGNLLDTSLAKTKLSSNVQASLDKADLSLSQATADGRYLPVVHVAQYGATGNGTTDDSAAIAAAINAVVSAGGGQIAFSPRRTYKLTTSLTIPAGSVTLLGNGATLDCSSMPAASGFALQFVPANDDLHIYNHYIADLRVIGPNSNTNNLDGAFIGRPGSMSFGSVAGFSFRNVIMSGFRDNITLGNQTWLIAFFQCASQKAWRYGVNIDAVTNAGENYSWHGGVISDCANSGTAVGFYTSVQGNADCNFFGTSFDYNDTELQCHSGEVMLSGCHLENRHTTPMINVDSTGGFEPTKLTIAGTVFAGTETTPGGRATFITAAGDRTQVRVTDGSWSRFGSYNSELVTVTSGSPLVYVDRVDPVIQNNNAPAIAAVTSQVYNGGFNTTLAPWSLLSTVNFIRNNGMAGAAVGTPGTRPSGWAFGGATNGLTAQVVAVDFSSGAPTLVWRLSGTPSASGTYGFYPESNAIPVGVGQLWTFSIGLRAAGTISGLTSVNYGLQERSSGGTLLTSTDLTLTAPTVARSNLVATRTVLNGSVAWLNPYIQLAYTSGVAIDVTIAIDTPMLYLSGDPATPTITQNSGSAIPTPRHMLDSATVRSGATSLTITNNGTGSYGLFQKVACTPGRRLLVRGYAQATITAGSCGYRVEWLDISGVVIGSMLTVGTDLTATTSSWAQVSGAPTAPVGTASARVWAYTASLNGQAWFDDVQAWVL